VSNQKSVDGLYRDCWIEFTTAGDERMSVRIAEWLQKAFWPMNRKAGARGMPWLLITLVWLIMYAMLLHFTFVFVVMWTHTESHQFYELAQHTARECESNAVIRSDPDMFRVCADRARWLELPYSVNIFMAVVAEHVEHLQQAKVAAWALLSFHWLCGDVCFFQIGKLLDSVISSVAIFLPLSFIFIAALLVHRIVSGAASRTFAHTRVNPTRAHANPDFHCANTAVYDYLDQSWPPKRDIHQPILINTRHAYLPSLAVRREESIENILARQASLSEIGSIKPEHFRSNEEVAPGLLTKTPNPLMRFTFK
jgi:hypothetical protein